MDFTMPQGQAVDLDWSHPGPDEISIAVDFIQSEDQRDPTRPYALSATFDPEAGKFRSITPYARLERSLRMTLPEALGLEVPQRNTTEVWGTLCDKLLDTENDYTESQQSSWRRIWHTVGKASENVDVWVAWIPDEFGLSVVKTGLALVIKLAGRSLDKRDNILKAFEEIRQAIASADPSNSSFQAHEDVIKARECLQKAIVESIEQLIDITKGDKSQWRRMVPKSKDRKKRTDVETVLKHLSENTKAFKRAIKIARDHFIQRTDTATHYTAVQTTLARRDADENNKIMQDRMNSMESGLGERIERLAASTRSSSEAIQKIAMFVQQQLEEAAVTNPRERREDGQVIIYKNGMMAFVLESKRKRAEEELKGHNEQSQHARFGAVISENNFWELFAEYRIEEDGPEERDVPRHEISMHHPVMDLKCVLAYRGDVNGRASSQAQTLLRHGRFLAWMNQAKPDLILVNANIRLASQDKLSAMSIFCADLVGCLVTVRPEDVTVHFFCSLHVDYEDDRFPGPAGLVRSLIIQVFLKLVNIRRLNLDFLYDRKMVEDLENRNLKAMCNTLHKLLYGFPAGTRVFCVIDSISMLDTFDSFWDLEVVMQYLRDIVEDRNLPAFVKVLMANNHTCSMDLQSLPVFEERPDRVVNLSASGLMPGGMSTRGMQRRISRSSSPSFSIAEIGRMDGNSRRYNDYESDDEYSY
ncbi:hypothetical protein KVR01_010389 [Diaporthe batatas]|uniref:uncharacterized protein n=1 Tax=Diaporthe batatas TaxID=748121 RepID=UPI001D03B75D|nr:uncharacterized protein KVR01_010389 [Diaporthe batatas]KAG8159752.1 hypothetical protein KVR01_010389 [Diaporthe batatas]